jgi:uncharacterized protein GlcG (DUF336 family)
MRQHVIPSLASIILTLLGGWGPYAYADSPQLNTDTILRVLTAAVDKARELGVPMGISVVDQGGNLVGFIKMDGTFTHTHYSSFSKAYTAASVRKPTHETGIPAEISAELKEVTGGRFTTLSGGFPLVLKDRVVGGIGVGGGNAQQDIAVARAGMEAAQEH